MDDQTRAFLRDLFAPHPDAPPADVVPPSPLTLADLDEANQAAGVSATVTTPGAMTFDVDGIPTGFDPPTTNTVISGGRIISPTDLQNLGVSVAEAKRRWPNLAILDEKGNKQ